MPAHPSTGPAGPPPPADHAGRGDRRRGLLAVLASMLVAVLLGGIVAVALGPRATLDDARSGDPALIRDTEAAVGAGRGLHALSVARVENGRATFAGLGSTTDIAGNTVTPGPDTRFELGSITKTFTGMLLADAVERGEMKLEDPLSTHLPELASTPAGGATLQQLATHTSGLPSLPLSSMGSSYWSSAQGADPYGSVSTDEVIAASRFVHPSAPGGFSYSNLGMALLGHAEARAARAPSWADLVQQRLLTPLGMNNTAIVDDDDAEQPDLMGPRLGNGLGVDAWAAPGFDPTGVSTRTTAADMARFAQAVIDGRAPGMAAVDPVPGSTGERRSGLAWRILSGDAGDYLWHNGGTGGTRTVIAIDRHTRRAALVLSNSANSVDTVAPRLIGQTQKSYVPHSTINPWIMFICAVLAVLAPWWYAWRAHSRTNLIAGILWGLVGAVVSWTSVSWDVMPEWLLGSLLGVAFAGIVFAVERFQGAPTWPVRRRWAAVLDLVVAVVLLALFALAL